MNDNLIDLSPQSQELADAIEQRGYPTEQIPDSFKRGLNCLVRYSPRLSAICRQKPEVLVALLQDEDLTHARTPRLMAELRQAFQNRIQDPELAIRYFHRDETVRIAWRDLCNLDDIQFITQEISYLADAVVEGVFRFVWDKLTAQYGEPLGEDGESSNMCVIGMGKLGGQELNFSSDIDLMFVYDKDGHTAGGPVGKLDTKRFYAQLTQEVCDILGKPTPEGFLYRVDLRLRPEGDRGALAAPLMAVEVYYHTYGQNWERQSLLKARPIAGHSGVGKAFLQLITPFTYRKYVDEVEVGEVLRTIDAMRMRSIEQIKPEQRWNNFKNGFGGIRDIEFFVQAVQLLYGGQYPEIKMKGTLESLLRMHQSHLLHSRDFAILADAYRFMRRIEHRLQMVDLQQVYELPQTPEAQERLAESLRFKSYAVLLEQYRHLTQLVRNIYDGVFKRTDWSDHLDTLITQSRHDDTIRQLLASYEFEDTQKAFAFLQGLMQSPDAHLQLKTTRLFKAILPRLLRSLQKSPDSDMALANFEKLVTGFKAKSALYQTLSEQPPLLDLLVSVISSSGFLTRLALRDVSLLDTVGRDGYLEELISRDTLEEHLKMMKKAHPKAALRDALLRVQNASMFRSGIRFLLGLTDVEHMGEELANIADFVLEHSMKPVQETMRERYPEFAQRHGDQIAILGFGKLGGREFNVASDCDLVMVYTDHFHTDEIDSAEYFHRWVNKYSDYLQSKSPLGFLYEVDTRLRPHGQSSPQAASRGAMREYYRSQAQFWEKMALSRARFICGHPDIKSFLEELKQEILFDSPASREEIESLLKMREKIEKEKKTETLKAAPGGLIDVEFIAQALVLCYGHKHQELRKTSTVRVIRQAAQEGVLSKDLAYPLVVSYLFLRDVENRMRIVNNVSMDSLPEDRQEMEKLTRRYALRMDTQKFTPETFLEMIHEHAQRVRSIYQKFFSDLIKDLV